MDLAGYHSYATMTQELQAYDNNPKYDDLYKLESIGKSVQGRELWAVEITQFKNSQAHKPEAAYLAAMHGNEPVSMEMTLNLINNLLTSYTNVSAPDHQRVVDLVNSTDLWFVPLINPDGWSLNQRRNANGKDLNRSFPDLSTDPTQQINLLTTTVDDLIATKIASPALVPEVTAVLNWSSQHRFAQAANFHTGAPLVVNYPYDAVAGVAEGEYALSPDDALFQYTARAYSSHNLPMWNSKTWDDGIVNGNAWFTANGTMQDWAYRYTGTPEVTIELFTNAKSPPANKLPGLWNDNRDAMFSYLATSGMGVSGQVVDPAGKPVSAAVVVTGSGYDPSGAPIAIQAHQVFTNTLRGGDFHRLLPPGTYQNLTITVSSPGYSTSTQSLTATSPFTIRDPGLKTPGPLPTNLTLPRSTWLGPITLTKGNNAPGGWSLVAGAPTPGGGFTPASGPQGRQELLVLAPTDQPVANGGALAVPAGPVRSGAIVRRLATPRRLT